jgi:hypothetical protein
MPIYHFSEDPTIERFVPRSPLAHPEVEPLVWAIDEWRQPIYFVPRDCPRVCFWPVATTTPQDRQQFFGYVTDRMVVAIEAAWYERMRRTRLYRYRMPEEVFEHKDFYISRQTVVPLGMDTLDNLPLRMIEAGVELRICASLVPLGKAVIASTINFSLIRMRNAQGWAEG